MPTTGRMGPMQSTYNNLRPKDWPPEAPQVSAIKLMHVTTMPHIVVASDREQQEQEEEAPEPSGSYEEIIDDAASSTAAAADPPTAAATTTDDVRFKAAAVDRRNPFISLCVHETWMLLRDFQQWLHCCNSQCSQILLQIHTLFKVSQEGISKSKVERERARKREIFFPPSWASCGDSNNNSRSNLRNFQTCCTVDLHYTTKPNQENIEQELWIMIRNKRCYLAIWKQRTDWNLTRDRWSCGIEKFCNSSYGRWLLTTHNSSDHDGGSTPSLLELRLCFGESSFLPNSLEIGCVWMDDWCGWKISLWMISVNDDVSD